MVKETKLYDQLGMFDLACPSPLSTSALRRCF